MAAVINPFERPAQSGNAVAQSDQQRAIAEVQAAMMIARMNPRDQVQAMDRILNACTRPGLAEAAVYQYARGGSDISGPSIRLAEAIAQQWGNIQFGIRELDQSDGESTVQAFAWDVETNTRREMTFQVKHERHTRQGAKRLTDPRDIYELVANQGARRLRACILGIIPGDVAEAAVNQCEVTMKARADTSPEAIKKLLETFQGFGVNKEQIEKRIQRRIDAIQPAQIVSLKKIYVSLRDGMSTAVDWFESAAPKTMDDVMQSRSAAMAETVNQQTGEITTTAPEVTQAVPGEPPALSVATLIRRLNACKDVDAAVIVMTDPDVDALNPEDAGKLMAAYRAKFGDA
jgi:hypothetical protein